MKYEMRIYGSFENRMIVNQSYDDAAKTAEKLCDVMETALKQDGFEEIVVRYALDEIPEEKK